MLYTCDFKGTQQGQLKIHILIDKIIDEVKYYSCDIWDCKAIYSANLERHVLIQKNIDEVEHFSRDIWDFITIHRGKLKINILIHKKIDSQTLFLILEIFAILKPNTRQI